MSKSTIQKEYCLEDAPESLKQVIRIAQTGERSDLVDDGTYALYSEASSGRRYVIPAEYDSEYDKFLSKGVVTYDPSDREIRIRDSGKYLDDCNMIPRKIPSVDFEEVEKLLKSY